MGPSRARLKVIQSDIAMGNWNVKLLFNSMVKGRTALSGILYVVRCRPVARLTAPFVYSMSEERVKTARNLKVHTQTVNLPRIRTRQSRGMVLR